MWPALKINSYAKVELTSNELYYLKPTTPKHATLVPYIMQTGSIFFNQYKKNHIRFLILQRAASNEFSKNTMRKHCLTELTSSNVISALAVPANLRYSKPLEKFIALTIRRVLLQLYPITFQIFIKNQSSVFGPFWRLLNFPTNEIYINPLTNTWVFDVKLKNLMTITPNRIAYTLFHAAVLEPASVLNNSYKTAAATFIASFFKNKQEPAYTTKSIEYRLTLNWSCVFLMPNSLHCLIKQKKARSIKKRLTKRLTALAQRRFWIV